MLKTYAHHAPTPEALEKIGQLREGFSALQTLIEELVPGSRERSVAITNLEQSAMWTIKGLIMSDPESKAENL